MSMYWIVIFLIVAIILFMSMATALISKIIGNMDVYRIAANSTGIVLVIMTILYLIFMFLN